MFTLPNDTDHLVEWIRLISGAAPNTPAVYYHIPICTKVTCKSYSYPSPERSEGLGYKNLIVGIARIMPVIGG